MRWVALLLELVAASALAHPLAPSVLELRETGNGRVEVLWKTTVFRAAGSDPEPVLPRRCRAAATRVTTSEALDVRTRWTVDCGPAGLVGGAIGVVDPGSPAPSAVVRIALADGRLLEGLVAPDRPLRVPPRPDVVALVRGSAALGFRHMGWAPDHLLFVLGLVLLAGTGRRLVATIAAFVVAHSLTLTLATLGVIGDPAGVVDAAVAASLLVVAVELARRLAPPTLVGRRPWATATVFGLVHGLAFAAALRAAGTPSGTEPPALLGFNVGMDAALVAFVLAVVAVRGAAATVVRRLPWTRWIPVYAMGSLAVLWSLERAAALLR